MAQSMRALVLRVHSLRLGIKFVVPALSRIVGTDEPLQPVAIRWAGDELRLNLPSEPLLILTGSQRLLLRRLVPSREDAVVVLLDHHGRFRLTGCLIQNTGRR